MRTTHVAYWRDRTLHCAEVAARPEGPLCVERLQVLCDEQPLTLDTSSSAVAPTGHGWEPYGDGRQDFPACQTCAAAYAERNP